MAAKICVVVTVTSLAGAAVSALSFFSTQSMLASRHVGLSIGSPGALRAVAAFALIAPVSALVGMALAAVIRHAQAPSWPWSGYSLSFPCSSAATGTRC